MEYINLPKINDQKVRKKYYTPESIKHPAKAHIPMMIWILKKFVRDGDIVLDPMAGIFTTGIEGMRIFPNCIFIGVELEEKFVKMAQANIRKVEDVAKNDMFMKVGKAICVQGDARELERVLKEKVDKIITSPPFGQAQSGGGIAKKGYTKDKHTDLIGKRSYMPENTGDNPNNIDNFRYGSIDKIISSPPWGGKVQHKTNYLGKQKRESGFEYSDDPNNIGNLPHGQVDKIITIPPYGEGLGHGHGSKEWAKKWKKAGIHNLGEYPSEHKDNIGNLPHGRIDKIISSPPYEGSSGIDTEKAMKKRLDKIFENRSYVPTQKYDKKSNIGNVKGKTYLGEMLKVYQQCYRVLKLGGLMILITKDFIRNKKRVHLTEDTIKLCEMAGFKHIATYHRKIEHPSFWRILYKQKYPDAEQVEEEDITVFRKGF